MRRAIVVDCLTRLARISDPDVRLGPALDPDGYRTSIRVALNDGRPGYRTARSHDVVPVDSCLIAHPLAAELLTEGHFGTAAEVTVRVGARTGERIVIASPTAKGVVMPDDVVVVGDDELAAGRVVYLHEDVGGRRLRISARSFFQCRPDGAEVLVSLVGDALGDKAHGAGPLLDAYCGVGLFGALLAPDGPKAAGGPTTQLFGVESSRSSAADAVHNYGSSGSVARVSMERWRPEPVRAVVADPPRAGLGKVVTAKLEATGALVIALVSCDPASLARDVTLLAGHGYQLDHVTVVDLFGHTSHVETVSRFVRTATS